MLNQLLWLLLSGYLNLGLAVGLTCGALLLLRPLLKRVLSPRQRLLLWMTAWLSAYMLQGYQLLSYLHVLPVTFRDLITPGPWRTSPLTECPPTSPTTRGSSRSTWSSPAGPTYPSLWSRGWLP